jgi:hypothetical protein
VRCGSGTRPSTASSSSRRATCSVSERPEQPEDAGLAGGQALGHAGQPPAADAHPGGEQVFEVVAGQEQAHGVGQGAGGVGQGLVQQQRDVAVDVAGAQHVHHQPAASRPDSEFQLAFAHDPHAGRLVAAGEYDRVPWHLLGLQGAGQCGYIGRCQRRGVTAADTAGDPRRLPDPRVGVAVVAAEQSQRVPERLGGVPRSAHGPIVSSR